MASKAQKVIHMGLIKDNPVFRQILGICSALAVTNLMMNSLIMGIGLMFVTAFSSLTVSLIRQFTPKHIRMMVQTLIIAAYVIIVDIILKAYMPEMSKALGPYVGLIITNCIIMGRAESFAQNNTPIISFVDGLAMGGGYAAVLLAIATVRELLGFGSLFGINILGDAWVNWTLMIMPPGAFFMLGIVIWISKNVFPDVEATDAKGGAK
ncbi:MULTISPECIES: NADH:ubiquinone reductase (Na(+)-transporting) subunit D [unclassified Fusibacter]|uniref:NADH:ubiquinone reductase (Na(+)-transporting) subunit D n=1 Tax=unclassified Fusibacter TaxID=2624464 RepID=UPI00101190FD|nr:MULTISPECIES: NADH:ubiquinone reductase (Na(+)-transporting) subunit D [unclassified Fusibacter]MCK8059813.1 NADH:ubiquinone reductase (Na(+)-transporting) subunit D [Fusibacter sp. A2]NPE21614.1 NADH:ubiquinone reductase (Na(+)-transporting) subunit D [Fusibacter sp. A1]RXV62020.1 NADH:ubiquinone reductase (Na(+)-transporting) subunit D [Fusibacter sp. A1]